MGAKNHSNSGITQSNIMKHETDNQTALDALPASFNPIENPPGWNPAADLDIYIAAQRPVGAPVLPVGATMEDAYMHALRLIESVHQEIGVCLAVRAGYNAGRCELEHIHGLRILPRRFLIQQLHATDSSLAYGDGSVQTYLDEQADTARFLEDERDRLMAGHICHPGSVSLMEFHQLFLRMGALACELVEHYWRGEAFGDLFDDVAAPLRVNGGLFLHTAPQPGTCMRTVWRAA